jgi:hypothetical protein
MAIDTNGSSVWISCPSCNAAIKFDENGCQKRQAAASIYGITVDMNGNPQYTDVSGITLDYQGNVWQARYTSNYFYKHETPLVDVPKYFLGYGTHGAAGDSEGSVWFIQMTGANFASYYIPTQTVTHYSLPIGASAYTYSDMTGINRAMILHSATWLSKELSTTDQEFFWGRLNYTSNTPAKTQAEVFIRLYNGSWSEFYSKAEWDSMTVSQRTGSKMQIKINLRTQDINKTPSVGNIQFTCP